MKRIVIKKETSKVRMVPVSARRLRIVETGGDVNDPEGEIIWVKPKKGDTPEIVADYTSKLKAEGAVMVLPMPMTSEDAAVPLKTMGEVVGEGLGVRAVVEDLLSKVKEMPDKVREVVENAMSRAGL